MTEEVQTQPQEQPREFAFSLTETEANVIMAGLSKLPYEVVAALITKMQDQYASQQTE